MYRPRLRDQTAIRSSLRVGLAMEGGCVCCRLLAAAVPIAGLSLFRYGLHNNLAYLDVLSFLSKHGESFFANNSVNGILNGYLSPNNSSAPLGPE